MARYYEESELIRAFSDEFGCDIELIDRIMSAMSRVGCTHGIPISYIKDYASKHDSVCSSNLHCMIERYDKEASANERIPKFMDS